MKPLDYVLIAVLAVIVGLALFFTVKNAKNGKNCGGCGGDCANCHKCLHVKNEKPTNEKDGETTKK